MSLWLLINIPYSHVIMALILWDIQTITDNVNDTYSNKAYIRMYMPTISPLTDPDTWLNSGLNSLTIRYTQRGLGDQKRCKERRQTKHRHSPTPRLLPLKVHQGKE